MERMLQTSEAFYQSLRIPYRVVDIVSGELNDPAIRKIDLEAWFPSQGRFRELVSISNCTDYQSRLLETRFREGTVTNYPHMLNGTLVAVQRAITCFLEHFYSQQSDELEIPEPLQPFVRAKSLKKPK
jgi:seryl-tRNA synthetase